MPGPTDGEIKKMAQRSAPGEPVPATPRTQPTSRGGRALYTGLTRIARGCRSENAKLWACFLLGILEGHWTAEDGKRMLAEPAVDIKLVPGTPDLTLKELKEQGGPKLQPHLPETGSELTDLVAKYGLK